MDVFQKVSVIRTPDSGSKIRTPDANPDTTNPAPYFIPCRSGSVKLIRIAQYLPYQFYCLLKKILVANSNWVILFCIQANRRTKIDPGIFCN